MKKAHSNLNRVTSASLWPTYEVLWLKHNSLLPHYSSPSSRSVGHLSQSCLSWGLAERQAWDRSSSHCLPTLGQIKRSPGCLFKRRPLPSYLMVQKGAREYCPGTGTEQILLTSRKSNGLCTNTGSGNPHLNFQLDSTKSSNKSLLNTAPIRDLLQMTKSWSHEMQAMAPSPAASRWENHSAKLTKPRQNTYTEQMLCTSP